MSTPSKKWPENQYWCTHFQQAIWSLAESNTRSIDFTRLPYPPSGWTREGQPIRPSKESVDSISVWGTLWKWWIHNKPMKWLEWGALHFCTSNRYWTLWPSSFDDKFIHKMCSSVVFMRASNSSNTTTSLIIPFMAGFGWSTRSAQGNQKNLRE